MKIIKSCAAGFLLMLSTQSFANFDIAESIQNSDELVPIVLTFTIGNGDLVNVKADSDKMGNLVENFYAYRVSDKEEVDFSYEEIRTMVNGSYAIYNYSFSHRSISELNVDILLIGNIFDNMYSLEATYPNSDKEYFPPMSITYQDMCDTNRMPESYCQ